MMSPLMDSAPSSIPDFGRSGLAPRSGGACVVVDDLLGDDAGKGRLGRPLRCPP